MLESSHYDCSLEQFGPFSSLLIILVEGLEYPSVPMWARYRFCIGNMFERPGALKNFSRGVSFVRRYILRCPSWTVDPPGRPVVCAEYSELELVLRGCVYTYTHMSMQGACGYKLYLVRRSRSMLDSYVVRPGIAYKMGWVVRVLLPTLYRRF